jgi:hypothetical protein
MAKDLFKDLATADDAAFDKALASLQNRGDKMQNDVHRYLCGLAIRWAQTGDVRPVAKYLNALLKSEGLKGMRLNAVRAWAEEFMGAVHVEEGENKGDMIFPRSMNDGKHIDVKKAVESKWWMWKTEPKYVPITDPVKMITQLAAKLEKDRAKCGEASVVDPAMIEALKAVTVTEPAH